MKKYSGIALALLLVLGSPAAFGASDMLTKSVDESRYVNKHFELEITKPDGWFYQSPEQTLKMSQKGAAIASGDDANLKAMMAEAAKSTLPLFAFFSYPPGTPGKLNANVIGTAESTELAPGVKSGCDYLQNVRQVLEMTQMNMKMTKDCGSMQIDGSKMAYLDATLTLGKINVTQRYYACLKGKHAIGVVASYFDKASMDVTTQIVKGLKLKCAH
ncbi:MAG: hypothetical protein Q4G71_00330 [Pseudomonadota bacterium]|nr:hypothetical protein [Pseudomonadota bacterium]